MEKRKRPFTPYEKQLIKEITVPYLSIIEAKKTDAVYNKQKDAAWMEIARKFNESPQCQKATHAQVKKLWLNMKARARDFKTAAKQRLHTGGGSYVPDPPPEDDLLGDLSQDQLILLPTIKVTKDSDGPGNSDGDEDDLTFAKRSKGADPLVPANSPHTPVRSQTLASPKSSQTTTVELKKARVIPKHIHLVDSLKKQLIENDIAQRKVRFEQELEQSAAENKIKLELLNIELEHKKKLYALIEEEHAIKIRKAKDL